MKRAFTIIELLVVVAVIAILAAIALPNFLEAQTRAKVSRVEADLRTITTGLEIYFVDNNSYPPSATGPDYRGFISLTTPISYVSNIFPDPFNFGFRDGFSANPQTSEESRLNYYELGTGRIDSATVQFPATEWGMAAYGPDSDDDTSLIGSYPRTNQAVPYESTNGTISSGDVYRLRSDRVNPNFISELNPLSF